MLQRPILRASASFLDFLVPSRYFNVQSAAPPAQFWTSSCLSASSTSNPPRFGLLFGLSRAFPLLQRPICNTSASFLDFLVPFHHFNVQSVTLRLPFWTSSCLPASSTSNPPHRQHNFGLPRAFPLLQRPILRAASTVICEKLRHISSYGASAHTAHQLTRRISSHDTSARMTHILTLQPLTLTYSAVPQTAHRPSVEYPSL